MTICWLGFRLSNGVRHVGPGSPMGWKWGRNRSRSWSSSGWMRGVLSSASAPISLSLRLQSSLVACLGSSRMDCNVGLERYEGLAPSVDKCLPADSCYVGLHAVLSEGTETKRQEAGHFGKRQHSLDVNGILPSPRSRQPTGFCGSASSNGCLTELRPKNGVSVQVFHVSAVAETGLVLCRSEPS